MASSTGVETNKNMAPDVTNFTMIGLGTVDEADLPDAADYPDTLVIATSTSDSTKRLFVSDGSSWTSIALSSDLA